MNHRVFVMYLWQTSTLKAHLHSIYSGYTDMSGDSGGLSSYYNLGRYDLSVEEVDWVKKCRLLRDMGVYTSFLASDASCL